MRLKSILGIGCLSAFVAAPVFAGVFVVDDPGGPNDFDFTVTIRNDDGFDLTKITFDLTNTSASVGGPLVFGGSSAISGPAGGTATPFGVQDDLKFGWTFTGFNTGETFVFNWDPDAIGLPSYGAVLPEAAGTILTLETTGGTVTGTMIYQGNAEGGGALFAIIQSPDGQQVPEPATLALLGLGLAGLGFSRRRKAA